jgi:hypothetical protein
MNRRGFFPFLGCFAAAVLAQVTHASDYVVAVSGGDFTSIQAALDFAEAGDRVLVRERAGGWNERVQFTSSGSAVGGYVQLVNFPGESPVLDATGLPGEQMLRIVNQSFVRVEGLEFRNNVASGDGSGVRVEGQGTHIEIVDCVFHDLSGDDSMAITVYGTSIAEPIENLLIRGNEIYDCAPAQSEALTLNGNVRAFIVEQNFVRDVNNIGIDFIGGEPSINAALGAREGVCRDNVVIRALANYGGGFGAGIYVDGGRDILIERNLVVGCDLGIEIGAENAGWDVYGIVCRNNVIAGNEKAGLVFGGYDVSVGRVRDCVFEHNLIWKNHTIDGGISDVWIQYAESCSLSGNIVVAGPSVGTHGDSLVGLYNPFPGATVEGNLWYGDSGSPGINWNGGFYDVFADFQAATGLGAGGLFSDPLLVDPDGADNVLGTADDDYSPSALSPAIDAGDGAAWLSAFAGDGNALTDFTGTDRLVDAPAILDRLTSSLGTQPDLGAVEYSPTTGAVKRFCSPLVTSYGNYARMGLSGTTSVQTSDLSLEAHGVPPLGFGFFFYGSLRNAVPVGEGIVCLGGSVFRLTPVQATSAGSASYDLNLSLITGPGVISPGESWVFQHWFRDPSGGPSGYNFSDALEINFLP